MNGSVVHFEIPADNVERAQKFYSKVFGWNMMPMPEMHYTMVGTTASNEQGMPKEPGAINGGLAERGETLKHPTVTLSVEDIEAASKTIVQHGGTMIKKRTPIGDGSMGFTAYFKDPEGNVIGLYELGKQ
jgi:predicted enzyme related to lactoylglutathione lyase